MDLRFFRSKYNQVIYILKYIYDKKEFLASELKNKFKLSNTTLYRYLDNWWKEGIITRKEVNGDKKKGAQYIYHITLKLTLFFIEFRNEVLNILLTTELRIVTSNQ